MQTSIYTQIDYADIPSLQGEKLNYSPFKCGLTSKEQNMGREKLFTVTSQRKNLAGSPFTKGSSLTAPGVSYVDRTYLKI